MRPLLALLILLVSLTTSGITSAIAATVTDGDDECCADADREATEHGDGDDESAPNGERDECPPLCHVCACSPMFAVPELVGPHIVARELQRIDPIDGYSQLPKSPPGTDVFHPPRRTS